MFLSKTIIFLLIFMALELVFWEILTGLALAGYVFSLVWKNHFIFILSCALLIGSSALLWSSGGLLLEHQVSGFVGDVVTYNDIVVPMSNVGLSMLALVFVAMGVVSIMFVNLSSSVSGVSGKSTFHY
jgi:hypothetical protein